MRSNRSSALRPARFARLTCEILEGRFSPSAVPSPAVLPETAAAPVPPGHYSLLVADLAGDGHDDFITASEDSDSLSVQMNEPVVGPRFFAAATFTPPPTLPSTIPTPSAVALGDLSGNGIDDLIVCCKSEDRVFVFLGLGGGRFGPELNGGAGLFTGISPDAVAVMPAENGSEPELVVADSGSNDVTIFQVTHRDNGWTLVEKERVSVGMDPTSVLVRDLSGSGTPDLVVTNAGDNTVSILPGTPDGLFDNLHARVLPTGDQPVQALVGNFDGHTDLVTVDRGSNDVTFFSGVDSPNPFSKRIPTGGVEPVAAVVEDVTGSGQSDLIVANYGDSRVTLLTGTASGLQMSQSIQETGLHPAALAAAAGMPAGSFYILNAEQSTPTAMQFNVSATSTVSLTSDSAPETTTAPSRLPIEEEAARTSDWLVPSRVVGTDLQALTPSAVAVVPGVALRADVPHPAAGSLCLPGGTAEDSSVPPPAPPPATKEPATSLAGDEPAGVQRFILGVDEEPPPRIGPEGASTMNREFEPAPEQRSAALPVVFGLPAPQMPKRQEPVASVDAVGDGDVIQVEAGNEVHPPAQTLVVLMAMGAILRQKEDADLFSFQRKGPRPLFRPGA